MLTERPNVLPEYLDMGDDEIAALGTRNQARMFISGMAGVPYVKVSVRREWLRPCDCELCEEDGPAAVHGFDSYWIKSESEHPEAVAWWVG